MILHYTTPHTIRTYTTTQSLHSTHDGRFTSQIVDGRWYQIDTGWTWCVCAARITEIMTMDTPGGSITQINIAKQFTFTFAMQHKHSKLHSNLVNGSIMWCKRNISHDTNTGGACTHRGVSPHAQTGLQETKPTWYIPCPQ